MRSPKQTDPLEATTVKSRRHSTSENEVAMEEPMWVKPNPVKHIPTAQVILEKSDPFVIARKLATERNDEREAAVNAAYANGFSEGKSEAERIATQQFEQMALQLEAYAQSIDQKLESIYRELAPTITKLSLDIAKKALETELRITPEIVSEVAKQICLEIGDRSEMVVRLHPEDVEAMHIAGIDLAAILGATNKIVVEPGRGITRGGCIVETSEGQWDGRIETRWNEITNAILELSGETSDRIDE